MSSAGTADTADTAGTAVKRRRRGPELEDALLDAAWAEVLERGYGDFTVEAVAERAGTSKAVLYRRWPGKADLIRAAVARTLRTDPIVVEDTGSLRDDVVSLLTQANQRRIGIAVQLLSTLDGLSGSTGESLEDIRTFFMRNRVSMMEEMVQRAVERGEVAEGSLIPRVIAVPFDLLRNAFLMTSRGLGEDEIVEIVDEIFIPLVRAHQP